MLINLSNKVIIVTGATGGIGSALTSALIQENAHVVINYLDNKEKSEILLREAGCSNSIAIKADITNKNDVKQMFVETLNKYGRIDALINNAGICSDNPIQLMSLEKWRKVIEVNLTGAFLCSREFSKLAVRQKYGKIVNVSSIRGQEGSEGQINYSTSKAGMYGFTKSLAKELGKYNVSVNAVCPGIIETNLNKHSSERNKIEMKRNMLPTHSCLSDLINFIIYLLSDKCIGISGQIFNLDARIK